jgi:hypothetical protein
MASKLKYCNAINPIYISEMDGPPKLMLFLNVDKKKKKIYIVFADRTIYLDCSTIGFVVLFEEVSGLDPLD